MRTFTIVLIAAGLMGISGCKKKKERDEAAKAKVSKERCKQAKKEAEMRWKEAEGAWRGIAEAWKDPALGKAVKKGIDERAAKSEGEGDAEAKAAAAKKEWSDFQKYWEEKKALADAAHQASVKALAAAKKGTDLAKASKAGYRAFAAAKAAQAKRWDKPPAWFENPKLVKLDATRGGKAYTLSTQARDANKSAVEACAK